MKFGIALLAGLLVADSTAQILGLGTGSLLGGSGSSSSSGSGSLLGGSLVSGVIGGVTGGVSGATGSSSSSSSNILTGVTGGVSGVIGGVSGATGSSSSSNVLTGATGGVSGVIGGVSGVTGSGSGSTSNILTGVTGGISGATGSGSSSNVLTGAIGGVSGVIGGVTGGVSGATGSSSSSNVLTGVTGGVSGVIGGVSGATGSGSTSNVLTGVTGGSLISGVTGGVSGVTGSVSGVTGSSSTLNVYPSTCQISSTTQNDIFYCACTGGSGNYNWRFYQLPQGWIAKDDKLLIPKGTIEDNKIYGCKIYVTDKQTGASVQKSLFFTFEKGKIKSIVDYKYDFNVNDIVPGAGVGAGVASGILTPIVSILNPISVGVGVINTSIDIVRQMFDNVIGIGGGVGLAQLRPYFLGKGGFYKGDINNPYLNRLPTDAEVDNILSTGTSNDIRVMIINVVRSKVNCKDINIWLNKILEKLRNKIITSKADIDATNQLIATIQAQIATLQTQLAAAQSNADINSLNAQIASLQATISRTQTIAASLQAQLSQVTASITSFQNQIAAIVDQKRQYQQADDIKAAQVNAIDAQIAQLQAQIDALNLQKQSINNERAVLSQQIADAQARIDAINAQIDAAQLSIANIYAQLFQAQTTIAESQAKINQLQALINSGASTQQLIRTIQAQIIDLQAKLIDAQTKLTKVQAIYNDFNGSYGEFSKIADISFNNCYQTIFNDINNYFNQDYDGNAQFKDKNSLASYLSRIFGVGNLRGDSLFINTISTFSGIVLRQSNIFSNDWNRRYGNIFTQFFSSFIKDDFVCSAAGSFGQKSFVGKIKSIIGYTATVADAKGALYTLYFGGCTRIQAVNKAIPEVGDDIYWLGTNKPGGKSNEYNVNYCTCL